MSEKDFDAKNIIDEIDVTQAVVSEKKGNKKRTEKSKNKKIYLITIVVILVIVLGVGSFLLFNYVKQKNLIDVSKELKEAALKEKISIEIKNSKIVTDIKLNIKGKMPKEATIIVDDNQVAYVITDGKFCNIKNFYEEQSKVIKYASKTCILPQSASKYIIDSAELLTTETEEEFGKEYFFAGADPDNYIIFAGSCYRILNVKEDIRAIFSGYAKGNTCKDIGLGFSVVETSLYSKKDNNFLGEDTTIRLTLEDYVTKGNATKKIIIDKNEFDKLANGPWYIGAVSKDAKGLDNIVESEILLKEEAGKVITWESKIGLPNVSDFIKASSNKECVNMKSANNNPNYPCREENFLYEEGYPYWTFNAVSGTSKKIWVISGLGSLIPYDSDNESVYIRPVIIIKGNNIITGNGTLKKPFIIK